MTSEELLGFVEGLKWDEYIDDEDIKEILKKVKNRVNAIENGGSANGDGVDADAPRIKLVIVGDGAVGKTSLLLTYTSGNFPIEYVPTVFDNTTTEVNYKGQQILLQLWDTAGQEDYDRLRPLSYPGSDIVLLCYSCVSEASYEAIVEKWYPEVNLYAAGVPQLLVGTKYDMREEGIKDPHMDTLEAVDSEKGAELAKDIEAAGFIETSAKTGHNLKQMFDLAIQIVMERRNNEAAKEKKEKSSSGSGRRKKSSSSSSSSSKSSKKSSSSSKEKKSSSSEKKSSSKSSSSSSKKEKK